jgi:hypothetical protein
LVPKELSNDTTIWLLAVTAVVSTTTLEEDAVIATLPAAAEPQTAGDADEEQLERVPISAGVRRCPFNPQIAPTEQLPSKLVSAAANA